MSFLKVTSDVSCVNVRSKSSCTLRRISATDWFHCRQFHRAVADPWTAALVRRCSERLAERAGCPERVFRCRLAAGGRSTVYCRHRHRLPILRHGGAARTIHLEETSRDCFDCAFAASTSEVGCQVLKRLEKQQRQ